MNPKTLYLKSEEIPESQCRACGEDYQFVSEHYRFCFRETCRMLFLSGPEVVEEPERYICSAQIYPSEIQSFAIELEKLFKSKIATDINFFELEMDLQDFSEDRNNEALVTKTFAIYEYPISWSLIEACRNVELFGDERFLVGEGKVKIIDLFKEALKSNSIEGIGDEIVREGYEDFGWQIKQTENWLVEVLQEIELNGRPLEVVCNSQ